MKDDVLNKLAILCDQAVKLKEDRYAILRDGFWKIVDTYGYAITKDYDYMQIDNNSERIIATTSLNLVEMLDYDGKEVTSVAYSNIESLGNGNFIATLDSKTGSFVGIINKNETIIKPFIYHSIIREEDQLILSFGAGGQMVKVDLNGKG